MKIPSTKLLLTIVLLICYSFTLNSAEAQPQFGFPVAVVPSATDPRISSFNDPHIVWTPIGQPRNQLLLFITGTGGKPTPRLPFLQTAAAMGYHVIELMYVDNVAAQQACIKSPDPDAYINFRLEIIAGGNFSSLIHVERPDSIESRLIQLLRYLEFNQPNMGWNQFLDTNNQVEWRKICVSGQSQGGGHAYVIAKCREVSRVIMFGSPKDYSYYFHRPAKGFDSNTRTPLCRFFAFNHTADIMGACNFSQQMEILQQIGLTNLGVADADHAAPFYNNAHVLVTNMQLLQNEPVRIHNAALNGNLSICLPAWQYLLTTPVQ